MQLGVCFWDRTKYGYKGGTRHGISKSLLAPFCSQDRRSFCSIVGLLVADSVSAVVIKLTFSGTYDTQLETVFGLTGSAIPYSHQITYDTALDTNTLFFAVGADLGDGSIAAQELHGYSASGIVATSLTFGTQAWTVADLFGRGLTATAFADLWFDTDISLSTPTHSWISFLGGSPGFGFLLLGSGEDRGSHSVLTQTSSVNELVVETCCFAESSLMTIESSIVEPVPEPTTLALIGLGLGLLTLTGWKCVRHSPSALAAPAPRNKPEDI
jgi:hypothetical protein